VLKVTRLGTYKLVSDLASLGNGLLSYIGDEKGLHVGQQGSWSSYFVGQWARPGPRHFRQAISLVQRNHPLSVARISGESGGNIGFRARFTRRAVNLNHTP
jgi:hypothetical protein